MRRTKGSEEVAKGIEPRFFPCVTGIRPGLYVPFTNEGFAKPGKPTLWICAPAVPGTYAAVRRALAHVANCTTEARQRAARPTRIGTTGRPVRTTEQQWFAGTFGGRIADSGA